MFYVITFAIAIALLVAAGVLFQAIGLRRDERRFPAPGLLVDVGGYRLHLHELGSGSPTVVLESGISASSLNWRRVQTEVAKFARVCSYDRAGLGWSELCDLACTPASLAKQLHTLLHNAGVAGPYILVGHSFGGLIVQALARLYANEIVGLVLVDPLDPAEWTPITDEQRRIIHHGIGLSRRGALAARFGVVRLCLNLLLAGNQLVPRMAAKLWSGDASQVTNRIAGQVQKMPPETWPLVATHWKNHKSFEGMARHFQALAESAQELSQVRQLSVPVTMLVGTQNEHPADPREYAKKLSPETRLIFAEKSGHWIQLDEPELVVKSIAEMLETTQRLERVTAR
ncbi:MAG TPA: alpha/beta hydrolase [Terriglobales bacterium]|nr:alpha/beta hydrolase [Terriglobales bacterium]